MTTGDPAGRLIPRRDRRPGATARHDDRERLRDVACDRAGDLAALVRAPAGQRAAGDPARVRATGGDHLPRPGADPARPRVARRPGAIDLMPRVRAPAPQAIAGVERARIPATGRDLAVVRRALVAGADAVAVRARQIAGTGVGAEDRARPTRIRRCIAAPDEHEHEREPAAHLAIVPRLRPGSVRWCCDHGHR